MAKYLTRFDYLIHNEDLTDAEVLDQIAKNNYHFHLVLSEAAQNEYLNHLIKNFGSINNTIRYMYYSSDLNSKDTLAEYEISLKEHSEIFEAVRLRQPEMAEALTVKHIKNVCKTVIAAQK